MFFLFLTIISSTLIIVTFKLIGIYKLDELHCITFNYFFAATYGLVIWHESITILDIMAKPWFVLSIITGFLFIIVFFLFAWSADKAGLAVTAVASKMSVVIPVLAGFFIFGDAVYWIKLFGIVMAVASFFLIFKTEEKSSFRLKLVLLPILLFLGNGINDTLVKFSEHHFMLGDAHFFLVVVFGVALLLSLLYMMYDLSVHQKKVSIKAVGVGFLLGSVNFGSTYFLIRSMAFYQASVLFPIVNVSIVSLSAIIGLGFFGERLRRLNWIGICLAIVAIFLISWAR